MLRSMVVVGFACLWLAPVSLAQENASTLRFTYQGLLKSEGERFTGFVDMEFALWSEQVFGLFLTDAVRLEDVAVEQGLFTVDLDFSPFVPTGSGDLWLAIGLRDAASGPGPLTNLPRTRITGAPLASNTRGLIVDSEGQLGVGTGEPEGSLHVAGGSLLVTGGDPDGRIGIGTANPQDRLHVNGGSILVTGNELESRIGIGTANPQDRLHVEDGSILLSGRDQTTGSNINDEAIRLFVDANGIPKLFAYNYATQQSMNLQVGFATTSMTTINGALTITGGADIVEGFASGCDLAHEPGSVLVIDPDNPGELMCSTEAYDMKVAGVVSGANGIRPGIKLGQAEVLDGDIPVAMTGRVYVKASAENGPIRPGDLLTTASLPGHAMRVSDFARANGAVLGKAMSVLDEGEGLVLLLVNLQ